MRKGLTTSEAGRLGGFAAAEATRARKQKRIADYNASPKPCKACHTSLSYEKRLNEYCNHSCAANYNNLIRGFGPHSKLDACLFCSKELIEKGQHKYCSRECLFEFHWLETKNKLVTDGYDNSSANHTAKRYLTELHSGNCQVCNLNTWRTKPMPLVLDHINGNPYDNSLQNLRVICHNCNAQTDTFAGRNKGNGRIARAKRYIVEKKILDEAKINKPE